MPIVFQNVSGQIILSNSQESKAVTQRCSVKNVFLEISQYLQENTCARVYFLIKFTKLQLY